MLLHRTAQGIMGAWDVGPHTSAWDPSSLLLMCSSVPVRSVSKYSIARAETTMLAPGAAGPALLLLVWALHWPGGGGIQKKQGD